MYYFAYGSNMGQRQMNKRSSGARLIGSGVLKDYRLDFTISAPGRWNGGGCADIVAEVGSEVWGLVYELAQQDIDSLDRAEGPRYRRIPLVVKLDQQPVEVYAYEVIEKAPFKSPASQYMEVIKNAAKEYGFPQPYKDFLDSVPAQP